MADAKQEVNTGTSQSRSVLAKPRLGGFGSSGFGASTFGSILRPSTLKPGSNPFLKATEAEESEKKDNPDNGPEKAAEERLTETKEDAPKFVPLGASSTAPRTASQVPPPTQPASSGFVFGQNLSERVVMQESVNNGDAGPSEHNMKNGTSELLFTSAAASVKENNQEESNNGESSSASGVSLAAAAAEYERAQARPPPPAVTTTTGEEDEINVMQLSCRLFAWEAGSWRERGRGVLRLNDAADGADASRLVVRVAGSLRVVLNTKIWPDMVAERAGSKSLRITASDAQQQIKLFLIMGAPGDIVQLHRAVAARVSISRRAAAADGASRLRERETGEPCPAHELEPRRDDETPADDDETPADDDAAQKRKEPVPDDASSPKRRRPEQPTE